MTAKTNNIHQIQNEPSSLKLLRARSALYDQAARRQMLQILITVLVPIIASIFSLMYFSSRPYIAFMALVITFFDLAWLDRSQRDKIKMAAKISEEFDCCVLSISWNHFVAGKRVDPELIEEYAQNWKKGDQYLLDWYPIIVRYASLPIGRIACQRANVRYDSTIRRRWNAVLILAIAVLVAALTIAGLALQLDFPTFVTTVVTPVAPVVVWSCREFFRQQDAAASVEGVKGEIEGVVEKIGSNHYIEEQECARWSREFQDGIFLRRASNPLPFPFIYKLLRPKLESQMNIGAEQTLRQMGVLLPE